MKRIVLLLFVVLPVPSVDAARVQVSTGAPVDVLIAVGAPTVVTFPEKVTAIPTSADPEALSLEIEGERLFIQSLREGFGAVLFVVGQSGRLYLLNLVEHEPPDIEVQLVLPQEPPRFGDPPPAASRRPSRPQRRVGNPMRRLLVAMVKGEALPGVKVLAHDQPLAMSSELEIRTTHLYAAGRYLGFIGKASNLTDGPFVLRLPEYQARGSRRSLRKTKQSQRVVRRGCFWWWSRERPIEGSRNPAESGGGFVCGADLFQDNLDLSVIAGDAVTDAGYEPAELGNFVGKAVDAVPLGVEALILSVEALIHASPEIVEALT